MAATAYQDRVQHTAQRVSGRVGQRLVGASEHGKNFCPRDVGKSRQVSASDSPQAALRLAFGVHNAPQDAPAKLVGQVDSPAQALAVAMRSGGHKLAYVAACIGKSEGYVSRLRDGKRPIPHKLVGPLCAATGSNLLRQYLTLQAALGEVDDVSRLADLMRKQA